MQLVSSESVASTVNHKTLGIEGRDTVGFFGSKEMNNHFCYRIYIKLNNYETKQQIKKVSLEMILKCSWFSRVFIQQEINVHGCSFQSLKFVRR